MLNEKQIAGIAKLKTALSQLEKDDTADTCGTWSEMKKNTEGAYSFPHISYEAWVDEIRQAAYDNDLMSTDYISILEEKGIKTSGDIADFTLLPLDVALAVLTMIFRSERFCEGAIQSAIEDGSLQKTIERLVHLADA